MQESINRGFIIVRHAVQEWKKEVCGHMKNLHRIIDDGILEARLRGAIEASEAIMKQAEINRNHYREQMEKLLNNTTDRECNYE